MHATVSKKSTEQIRGKTCTADDEGLATPIKVIFGGKSSAEPIEVDGSGKEKIDNDVEIEDADISPTPQKIETPKSKKKKRKKRSPTNDQTDQRPDVVHREKALRQGDTGEHSGQTVEVGDIFRAPKLSDLDGEYFFFAYCTIRLAKKHDDGWEAHHISEQVEVIRHEDNRGQKNYIVKGGGGKR